MRLLLEDIISELRLLLSETKSLKQRVLIKDAIASLQGLKAEKEQKLD